MFCVDRCSLRKQSQFSKYTDLNLHLFLIFSSKFKFHKLHTLWQNFFFLIIELVKIYTSDVTKKLKIIGLENLQICSVLMTNLTAVHQLLVSLHRCLNRCYSPLSMRAARCLDGSTKVHDEAISNRWKQNKTTSGLSYREKTTTNDNSDVMTIGCICTNS